ncbi:hypothetical protein [Microbispora sp. GKU 823]|uniref:hypothetical protein n=1 Tax=Microbispora sp. GKU 823 TaxID=1652100 RepID=UPI001180230D|nr:hypothetical protein [Microbispora sp. GKU 823]
MTSIAARDRVRTSWRSSRSAAETAARTWPHAVPRRPRSSRVRSAQAMKRCATPSAASAAPATAATTSGTGQLPAARRALDAAAWTSRRSAHQHHSSTSVPWDGVQP